MALQPLELFSVAIVTRNRAHMLQATLSSLDRQGSKPDEVVIIDNGSTDSTPLLVEKFRSSLLITYDRLDSIGVNRARNRAIDIAAGDIIAFIDDDAVAVPTWVEEMKKMFEANKMATAVVGIKDNLFSDKLIPSVIQFTERDVTIARDHTGDKVDSPTLVDTCNFAFRKNHVLASTIRFNESLVKGGDRHFGHQLFNAGKKILFAENSIVLHAWPRTLKSYFKMRWNAGIARNLITHDIGQKIYFEQTRTWGTTRLLKFALVKGNVFGPLKKYVFLLLVLAGHATYLYSFFVNRHNDLKSPAPRGTP